MSGVDCEGIELARKASDPNVAPAVDDVARIAAEAIGQHVGRQSLAAASGVEPHAGWAPDSSRLVVDLDPPPLRLGARPSGAARRGERERTGEGHRIHACAGFRVSRRDDRAEQGGIHESNGPFRCPEARPHRAPEKLGRGHLGPRILVERGQLAVRPEA